MRLIKSGLFNEKRILLIDKDSKKSNDRTWCFWEKENGFFDDIVFRKWNSINFYSEDFSEEMHISPYQYKMIRGVDFNEYCFATISSQKNIEILYAEVGDWNYSNDSLVIQLNGQESVFQNVTVFNSIYRPDIRKKDIRLLQHFKGWIIETKEPVFDPGKATMMDFRISQHNGTSFVYVLPFNKTTALVEYTLFTKEVLRPEAYNEQLIQYISSFLKINEYKVTEEEFGIIPMTTEKFHFKKNGWNIGTAGGQTKSSSGYTFQFIQKRSEQIFNQLIDQKPLDDLRATSSGRFRFYDNTLLQVLSDGTVPGKQIFTTLFKKNKPQQVLRFLDNETSLKDELKIISSLPTWPFLKAAIKQL